MRQPRGCDLKKAVTVGDLPSFDPDEVLTLEHWRDYALTAGDGLVVVDSAGVCQWASEPGFIVGAPAREVLQAEDAPRFEQLLLEEPAGPAWLRVVTDSTSSRWVSAIAVPLDEAAGWTVLLRHPQHLDAPTDEELSLDSVTGVAGRERALDEVAWLLSATPRTGKEIAVVCCGMDNLTAVNDELGRMTGDEVLRVAAGRISDALRSGDLVARLDGDRFLVVLRGVHHLRGAIRVANKLRVVVEDPIPLATGDLVQTMSVGVTLISRGESVDSVLERAEGAMSMAKQAGRNTVMSSPPI